MIDTPCGNRLVLITDSSVVFVKNKCKKSISKLLYDYYYPFSFPTTFLTHKNIYDLHIKTKVIEAISTVPLEKIFHVEVFLEQFNFSTKKKTLIKKNIVKIFSQLQTTGIIKNHDRLIKKSKQVEQVNTLTHLLVGQTNIIYFYENILKSDKKN